MVRENHSEVFPLRLQVEPKSKDRGPRPEDLGLIIAYLFSFGIGVSVLGYLELEPRTLAYGRQD